VVPKGSRAAASDPWDCSDADRLRWAAIQMSPSTVCRSGRAQSSVTHEADDAALGVVRRQQWVAMMPIGTMRDDGFSVELSRNEVFR
jgi:hypothetical protein